VPYFIDAEFALAKGEEKEWFIVADVNQDASHVAALSELIKKGKNIPKQLMDDITNGTDNSWRSLPVLMVFKWRKIHWPVLAIIEYVV